MLASLNDILKSFTYCSYQIGRNKYLFILKECGITYDTLNGLSSFAKERQIVLSISDPFDTSGSMYKYFNDTNLLSYHYFLHQSGCLLSSASASPDNMVLKNILDDLSRVIDTHYVQGIENVISSLPQLFIEQNYTMAHVVWFYNALIGRLNIASSAFVFSQMDEEELNTNFQSFSNLCVQLLSSIKEMIAQDIDPNENASELWKKTLDYIEKTINAKYRQGMSAQSFTSASVRYTIFQRQIQVKPFLNI